MTRSVGVLAAAALLLAMHARAAEPSDTTSLGADQQRPDIVLADFEGDSYGQWVAKGDAFGDRPARGALSGQMQVAGFEGEGLVNTYLDHDRSEGTLTSPKFKIERNYVNFLIGGGRHPGETAINLILDGKIVRTMTGSDNEYLLPVSWDVTDLVGKTVQIEIVDHHQGGWGHINVDQIVLSDQKVQRPDTREELLKQATASVAAAAAKVKDDNTRPAVHFVAPGNWINDPNGPIQYGGYYHLFYQHNPYGDAWGNMHWGHARSKDLANWEHLPIALWPSKELGEDHVFSGCAVLDVSGKPMIFYTSIGPRLPEQWAAVPEDDELIQWKKHPQNPLLTEELHGETKIEDWRDPFIFQEDGRYYMVVGGHRKGGKGCVVLYSSEDLVDWKYVGIPFEGTEDNWECPNLFKLGDQWVLVYSPHGIVRYYTGQLDVKNCKFTPAHHGTVDFGDSYYAPNCLLDDQGRRIMWGWIRGFPNGLGWNGCMTVPRVVTLENNVVVQKPAEELKKLRGKHHSAKSLTIEERPHVIENLQGNVLEITAQLEPTDGKPVGLRVGSGKTICEVEWDGKTLIVGGQKAPLQLSDRPLDVHVFVDRRVVEVFADDGRVCVAKVVDALPEDSTVKVYSRDGRAKLLSLDAWELNSIGLVE